MTKEQLKYYIDNLDNFKAELIQKIQAIPQERLEILQNLDMDSAQDFERYYEICSEFCKDILEKYHMNLEIFKTVFSIQNDNGKEIIGREKYTQLLKDIIDIYEDQANDILGTNNDEYDISSLDGIIVGENNDKYIEFYKVVALNRCKEKLNLSELGKTFLSIHPKIISEEFLTETLSNIQDVKGNDIYDFIENAPIKVLNANTMKIILSKIERIEDFNLNKILPMIQTEMYDRDVATQLLEKVNERSISTVFRSIPSEIKDIEMYEYAISKAKDIAYELPEEKIEGMNDDEYRKWCEDQIIGTLKGETDQNYVMAKLPEHLITERICTELIRKMPNNKKYMLSELFKKIPENYKSRTLYEELIKKSPELIEEIPEETLEEGLTQKEYDKWVEEAILKVVSESTELERIIIHIPRIRYSEKVWNSLMDRAIELGQRKVSIKNVPIQNRTINMYERALKEDEMSMKYIPSIDRNLDEVRSDNLKKEYKSWISGLTEEQKQEYRNWYEEKVIDYIIDKDANLFDGNYYDDGGEFVCIPKEAITEKMIQAYLDVKRTQGIEKIPVPDEFTKYNEQYENIVLYAISMLEEKKYLNSSGIEQDFVNDYDILDKIPKEYRTDKIIMEAIKKHCKYLDYADIESDNFEELLQIGYKNKLESLGRTTLSKEEIELMKRFSKNNSSLFSTLNLDILTPEIIGIIGENSIERIVRYTDIQYSILELTRDKDALITFGFVLENLKQDSLFIEPLIERLSETIKSEGIPIYNYKTNEYENNNFLKLASARIQNNSITITEEEKTIISYLAMHPQEAIKITNYGEILNFVANKNTELDKVINSQDVTLIAAKNAYLERTVGMNYVSVMSLIKKYGNDSEQLLTQYEGKELQSFKEKSEKESLEIIIKLKSLVEENDLERIRQAYQESIEQEDKNNSFERYKQFAILDRTLKRAYGRDITRALSNHDKENNLEFVEHAKDGREYVVRKLNGQFNRMISVMDAYRKGNAEGDMYDRWNTSAMAGNHALCYSFINESNPGTAMLGDKKGIVISISDFDAEAVTAVAPYDLCSDSRFNTTVTGRQQRFYTTDNLPNQTRGRYSEVDIEVQDVSEANTEYKKIQPTSIICFEEIDEDSINAAIELSKKIGKTIPIELIDRRELASQTRTEIDTLLELFKSGEVLQPELVGQIITKFNNVRNAHMDSNLADELLGEKKENENPEALFNKVHLNEMLLECIEIANERIKCGNVQEGLDALSQIKKYINLEREKNALMPSMYEKQYMTGIDLKIDQQIDKIQRENGVVKNKENKEIDSLRIVRSLDEMESITYQEIYGKTDMPEQLSFDEVKQIIDLNVITHSLDDVKEKGYYSENVKYSEEHIARVMIFSSAIANMEGIDTHQQKLLTEVSKYYSSGRMLDIKEPHEQYSAEIAGKELMTQYSKEDLGIIQAVIELQNFHSNQNLLSKQEEEYKVKLDDICSKYGIASQDKTQVDMLTKIIQDAVELDKTRFVRKAKYNCPDEVFRKNLLSTESAGKLIKFSYGIQDGIASEHLASMESVAHIDYDSDTIKKEIMEEFFTEMKFCTKKKNQDEGITMSPIVREMFFKHKFSEVDSPEVLGLQLSEKSSETREVESSERTDNGNLVKVYQDAEITLEDARKAYEQLSRTKNELEHVQGVSTLGNKVR
mgnify:CR=1 FL=1